MQNTLTKNYLENEKIQSFLRFTIVIVSAIAITYDYYYNDAYTLDRYYYIMSFPLNVLIVSLAHYYFINKYPNLFQIQRIALISIYEVVMTVYVMYLVGELSVFFVALLLWYIVGYNMRYGTKLGYVTYSSVILAWVFLLKYSDYWQQNVDVGLGWLIAFIVIPLYFFKLVEILHGNINQSIYRATHDPLTGLPNRVLFDEKLEEYIKKYGEEQKKFALIFIDLDKFKEVNDIYGHIIGDRVLKEAAKRIGEVDEFSSRLGGDEFVSIVQYKEEQELRGHLDKLVQTLSNTCTNEKIKLSASVGVAIYPLHATNAHELKKKSDKAMYKAKKAGKNRYQICQEYL